MSNTYGKFYGYTGLFPIIKAPHLETSHVVQLRQTLSNLSNGEGSLFSRTGLVHGARLFILDDVVYNGHPTREEHLEYEYLVVSLSFDGVALDEMAKRLAVHAGSDLNAVFQHCYGFSNDAVTADAMLKYLEQGQVTTSFFYVEADGDLQETLRAFKTKRLIADMLVQTQGLSTSQKKALVRTTAQQVAATKLPFPGGFDGVAGGIS